LVEVTQAGRLFKGSKTDLKKFLQKRGFKLFKDVGFDQIYVKKDAAKNVKNLKGGKK
jgi:predicted RNA binding protein YcfA (HicA-like mRNA interferase family)